MNLRYSNHQFLDFQGFSSTSYDEPLPQFEFVLDKKELKDAVFRVKGALLDKDTNIPINEGMIQVRSKGKIIGSGKTDHLGRFELDVPFLFINDIHIDLKIMSLGYKDHNLMALSLIDDDVLTDNSNQISATICVERI